MIKTDVVGCGLGRDPQSLSLRPANDFHRPFGRHVGHVKVAASGPGEFDIPEYRSVFSRPGHAGQAQAGGPVTGVHAALAHDGPIFGVGDDRNTQDIGVLEGVCHQTTVFHRHPVVREPDRPGVHHVAELGHALAFQTRADGSGGMDPAQAGLMPTVDEIADHAGIVDGRIRVGHRNDGSIPTRGGRPTSRSYGFLFFVAGLAEMRVQIHKTRSADQPFAVQSGNTLHFRDPHTQALDPALADMEESFAFTKFPLAAEFDAGHKEFRGNALPAPFHFRTSFRLTDFLFLCRGQRPRITAGQQIDKGHAHGHAVGHLIENNLAGPVGHGA